MKVLKGNDQQYSKGFLVITWYKINENYIKT